MKTMHQGAFGSFPSIYNELPPLKTDKIIQWLRKSVFTKIYLFYNKEKKTAICSNCGKVEMPLDVKHNAEGICPVCKAKVIFKSMGIGRKKLQDRARVLIFQQKGKSVYATLNMIYADYDNLEVEFYKDCEAVYKFNREEQIGYYTSYGWYYGGRWDQFTNIRIPYRTGEWADVNILVYMENIKEAFRNTDLKYCQLAEQANEWYPTSFIKLVDLNSKFESIEKLHKVGLDGIIESKLKGQTGSAAIKWKKNDLRDILGLPISEIPIIKKNSFTMEDLHVYKLMRQLKIDIKVADVGKYRPSDLLVIKKYGYLGAKKLFNYLNKQRKAPEYKNSYGASAVNDYRDYMKECIDLDLDITSERILFPKSLVEAHARTSAQVQVRANPEQQKKIQLIAKKMKELNFSDGDLFIKVADSAESIIYEGKVQGHCVGGYVKSVAEGRTLIFFVRKASEPDEPYYTLELKGEVIAQCRGKKNCSMTEEVKAFIDKWHEQVVINKKPKSKKQSKVA